MSEHGKSLHLVLGSLMMRRLCFSFLLLFLNSCSGGAAFPVVVATAALDATQWPDAGAAVLEEVVLLRYEWDDDAKPFGMRAVVEHWQRMKILRESGLAEARVRLPLDEFSQLEDIEARSVSADGDVVRMSSGAIRLLGPGHPESLDNAQQTILFTVPKASVGGVIDYRYKRIYENPLWLPVWRFGSAKPTLRSEFSIIAPKGVRFDYRYGQGQKVVEKIPLRQELAGNQFKSIFVETNLPPVFAEPFMADISHASPWLGVSLRRFVTPDGYKFRMNNWGDVFKYLETMLTKVGGEVGQGDVVARYREVRDGIKGLSYKGAGVTKPRKASKLWAGAPASSRDSAALLRKALEGSGAKVYVGLLQSRQGVPLPDDFVSVHGFDRVVLAMEPMGNSDEAICREDVDGKGLFCEANEETYVFLEPSCRLCRFSELSPGLAPGRVLIDKDGAPVWHELEAAEPEVNRLSTQYSMRLKIDGTVQGRMNGQARGVWAQTIRRTFANPRTKPSDQNAYIRGQVHSEDSPFDFQSASVANLARIDEPLGFAAELFGKITPLGYDRFRIRPLDLVGPIWSQAFRSLHRFDAFLPGPMWIESALALELPMDYAVEPRPLLKVVRDFGEYAAGYEKIDGTLNFTRRLILKKRHITSEEWPDFIDFIKEIRSAESRGIEVWRAEGLFDESSEP